MVAPPGDHNQLLPALAVNVTLPPWQKVVGPLGVMVAVGSALTVMVVVVESLQVPSVATKRIIYEPTPANVRDALVVVANWVPFSFHL